MSFSTGSANAVLAGDRLRIEQELEALMRSIAPGDADRGVGAALRYSVLGPGQRIRPLLALRIARVVGAESELTVRTAAAVELLHCASLIVDDLPCMDDESYRRDCLTVHKMYGEPTALLASFGLVAFAARCVVEQRCSPTELSSLIRFQIELLKVLDCCGLIEGQDLDLRLRGEEREAMRQKVNELKTVPLFELAAHAGLLFTDPGSNAAIALRRFSREFGISFQMVDDFLDGEVSSPEAARAQMEKTLACLEPVRPAARDLEELVEYLHARCL